MKGGVWQCVGGGGGGGWEVVSVRRWLGGGGWEVVAVRAEVVNLP